MPRKTKEQKELENKNELEKVAKKTLPKKASTTSKNTTTKKASTTKKPTSTSKKAPSSTTTKRKATTSRKEATTKKSTSATKKNATKATSTAKKKTSTVAKKATTKNTATKKATTKRSTSSKKKVDIVEYYDLPYRYNQTIVKVLAQTPTNLFIYWDISDNDRKKFKKQYGDNFFETTKPILIIYNDTLGYHFEVEINDFANSWYLHVADSKCEYRIELGRRPIIKTEKLNTDYIYITTSNEIEAPNNRILLDANQKIIYFKNVKTEHLTGKTISSISFIRNMGKIYNIYDFYKEIYQDENLEEIINNPSSGNSSSKFK